MDDVITIAIHVAHILSVVMLLGSAFYIRFVEKGIERIPAWYVTVPVIVLVVTGIYQFLHVIRLGPVDKNWHITFGIKMPFALHLIAVSLLQLRTGIDEAKRRRLMTGIVASGTVAVILGAVMRALRP